jgi:hypothetical protein
MRWGGRQRPGLACFVGLAKNFIIFLRAMTHIEVFDGGRGYAIRFLL